MTQLNHYCNSGGPWVDCKPTRLLLITTQVNNMPGLDQGSKNHGAISARKPFIDVYSCSPAIKRHQLYESALKLCEFHISYTGEFRKTFLNMPDRFILQNYSIKMHSNTQIAYSAVCRLNFCVQRSVCKRSLFLIKRNCVSDLEKMNLEQ